MVEKKTTSRVLISGRVEWFARKTTANGRWYQTGLYLSPVGMCYIYMEARLTTIKTVVEGVEHTMIIPKQITPRSAAIFSRKLIEDNQTS